MPKTKTKTYKTSYEWVGTVTHWKLCKRLKFDNTTKLYLHKLESVLENDTHKILCWLESKRENSQSD